MQTTNHDFADKTWLRDLQKQEDQRGFLGVIRDAVGVGLATGAILLLIGAALVVAS